MHKLKLAGIPMPDLYVCEDHKEARLAKSYGLPYVIRPTEYFNDRRLIGIVLLETLMKMFPYIDWTNHLGISNADSVIVSIPGGKNGSVSGDTGDTNRAETAENKRGFEGGKQEGEVDYCERRLTEFLHDGSAKVNIQQLQSLNLLPEFMSDIASAIKKNLYGYDWTEGYNKKRKAPIGNFNEQSVAPNLMILDISGSIPRGISATMLTLIDTLREQANADLIVTGSVSMWWGLGEKLPDPRWIRNNIGYGNECRQFQKLLRNHVNGREFGHVICFGDNDCPDYEETKFDGEVGLENVRVHKVLGYHTRYHKVPGYARWATRLPVAPVVELDTSWCDIIKWR